MNITFCQATYDQDFEGTKECIRRVGPYVNSIVIVYDDTLDDEQVKWLSESNESKNYDIHPVYHKFDDSLPSMRNAYINKVKEMGVDWVCVSDPDEVYSEELVKELRNLIDRHNKNKYNLLAVPVRDQFENIEKLDDLDLLKEVPGGYHETDYWKPLLIFKLYPDMVYVGIGKEKNVHETLITSIPFRMVNLDKKYFYVHKKSALKIWRNAARNMFIGGGGDNVGSENKLWVELRNIMSSINIKNWSEFEEFINRGIDEYDKNSIKNRFMNWLNHALQSPSNPYGTETRDTAKLYFALHTDQADIDVNNLIAKVPMSTQEESVGNFVTKAYFQVLGRHPDEEGKKTYVDAIVNNGLSPDKVLEILRSSKEYKEKFAKPHILDIGSDIHIEIPSSNIGKTKLSSPSVHDGTVALCIMGYHSGIDMIKESIETIGRVMNEIHVQGDDFNDSDVKSFRELGNVIQKEVQVHNVEWKDDFSNYKNKAISWANTEWVLILDHDEIPTPELAKFLKDIVRISDMGSKYDMISFDVIDTRITDGSVTSENRNSSGKALLHWNVPDSYTGNPHIWLKHGYPWRCAKTNISYRHVKEEDDELLRSMRNVFIGGGGDNTKHANPTWVELREVSKSIGITMWKQFNEYLIKGSISDDVLNILIKLSNMKWKDGELKDPLTYYFKLHPDEKSRSTS